MQVIKNELRTIRNLNKRGIKNDLTKKYEEIFHKLPPLEEKVMTECYMKGNSYYDCARKICYCERQVYRIVQSSIKDISENLKEREN